MTFSRVVSACVLATACGAPRAAPVAPRRAAPLARAPDEPCRRAVVSIFAHARARPEIRLFSAAGDAKAASYDAWLRTLGLDYRWVLLDDAARDVTKRAGLEGMGVVIDYGVGQSAVPLADALDANGVAWIARAARTARDRGDLRIRRLGIERGSSLEKWSASIGRALPTYELEPVDPAEGVPDDVDVLSLDRHEHGEAEQRAVDAFRARAGKRVVASPAFLDAPANAPDRARAIVAWVNEVEGDAIGDDERACNEVLASNEPRVAPAPTGRGPQPLERASDVPLVSREELARATSLRVDEPTRSATLVLEQGVWKISGARADQAKVRAALDGLGDVRLGETLAPDARSDAWLGLAPASAMHVVVSAGGETLVDVVVGHAGSRGTAVRVAGAPEARIARAVSVWQLGRETKFWRDAVLWRVDPGEVERIELSADRKWVFSRRGGRWEATLDGKRFAPLSRGRVDGLLNAYRQPLAEDFPSATDAAFDRSTTTVVRLVLRGGHAHAIRLGATRPDHSRFARVDGDATLYAVSAYLAAVADVDPARWR